MRAIILAGGRGTRLRPYTLTLPKPLVPVGNKTILEHVIQKLKSHGFTHITLAVNHMAELIMAFFGDGSRWDIKIDYSIEDKPLSTIGPLTLINDLPEDFLVMNGDVLTDLDYKLLMEIHQKKDNTVTVAAFNRKEKIDFGVLDVNKENLLCGFSEKPEYEFLVSMGVYIISKKVINKLIRNSYYGFDNLMTDSIKNDNKVYIHKHEGMWLDIGRPDDYENANKIIGEE